MNGPLIGVTAGEPSGDLLGAGLIRKIKSQRPDARFIGIGGPEMLAAGLESIFPMQDIAVMGFADVLKKLPYLFGKLDEAVLALQAAKPDVLVCVDAPDFNHRLAKRLKHKEPNIKIIDYVVPSVWFWRAGRARAMSRYFDHCLALLPFEPEVLRNLGGPSCQFIGHRAIEDVASDLEVKHFRETYGVSRDEPCLVILPGSRYGEISHLLPIFAEVCEKLSQKYTSLRVFLPLVEHLAETTRAEVEGWPFPVEFMTDHREKLALFRSADLAIAASGTVALEMGLAGLPMITGYPSNGLLTKFVLKYLARTPSVNLVNLVLDRPVVPELLADNLTSDNLYRLADYYLSEESIRGQTRSYLADFSRIMRSAGPSPDTQAAEAVLRIAGLRA